jgi:hypothetical protein
MPTVQNVADLKRATKKYWERLGRPGADRVSIWQEYARDLLPLEMEGKPAPNDCDTLVMLVGHSVEPLLQSVWAYQPKKLLLILSPRYGEGLSGDNFARILRFQLLPQLPEDRRVADQDVDRAVVAAEPAEVFRILVDRVRDRSDVVIDITGAKKSMVAGAFLYAAYANVPISYVDFDDTDYSTRYHRPYGYASYIQSFENPYTAFALRDWERVQQLYETFHFREARKLLEEDILPALDLLDASPAESADDPSYQPAVERLIDTVRCYELWDSGDFVAASKSAADIRQKGLDFHAPTAVEALKDIWPHTSDGAGTQEAAEELRAGHQHMIWDGSNPEASIFCQNRCLLVYAEDELARIQRLIDYNEDYRSALLRAASLNEVLLKARLANLWVQGELTLGRRPLKFNTLVEKAVGKLMLKALDGRYEELQVYSETAVLPSGVRLNPFWERCDLDLDTLIDLRNDTIHTYLSIPKNVAQAAAEVARHNLEDYKAEWIDDSAPEVTMNMPWRALCELCGADAFLPPNLLE